MIDEKIRMGCWQGRMMEKKKGKMVPPMPTADRRGHPRRLLRILVILRLT